MENYYSEKLSAERLQLCYEIAPPRVKQYLEAEIEFVLSKISPADKVLDLGCGYGRVLKEIVKKAKTVVGIDTSHESLTLGQEITRGVSSCHFVEMNAVELGFCNRQFDVVICVQNGISAFKVNQRKLVEEAIRVTRFGGTVLFSSYSEHFWTDRLEWFQIQSEHKLLGEIDYDKTGNGTIVCKDGFKATTVDKNDFDAFVSDYGIIPKFTEVDNSSIFCEMQIK